MTALLLALLTASPMPVTPVDPRRPTARPFVHTADGGVALSVATPAGLPLTVEAGGYGSSAFGQLRTAPPYTLADIINTSLDTEVWGTSTADGGTVTSLPYESALLLSAPGSSAYAKLRTHDAFRYQAGKGQRVLQTVAGLGVIDGGQVYRWGYYDDNDGLGWQYDENGLRVFVRSSTDGGVTNTFYAVDAGAWNPALGQIWEQSFQWLGVGEARFFLNGALVVDIKHPNTLGTVYMRTAQLPLSYEAWTGEGPATLKAICASVQSEGGSTPPTRTFSARRPATLTVAKSVTMHMGSLRPSATFSGHANRTRLWPTYIECATDTRRIRVDLVLNPTALDGAVFTAVNSTSAAEYVLDAGVATGGIPVGSFTAAPGVPNRLDLSSRFGELTRSLRLHAFAPGLDAGYDSNADTLSVNVTNIDSVTDTEANCFFSWQELRQ